MSSILIGVLFCDCAPLITTPYPIPLPATPACGAIVSPAPCWLGRITCQFVGWEMLIGPRFTFWRLPLGRTSFSATGPLDVLLTGVALPPVDDAAGAPLNTAPFFRFSESHWPL